jgi:hypothetical protein
LDGVVEVVEVTVSVLWIDVVVVGSGVEEGDGSEDVVAGASVVVDAVELREAGVVGVGSLVELGIVPPVPGKRVERESEVEERVKRVDGVLMLRENVGRVSVVLMMEDVFEESELEVVFGVVEVSDVVGSPEMKLVIREVVPVTTTGEELGSLKVMTVGVPLITVGVTGMTDNPPSTWTKLRKSLARLVVEVAVLFL